VVGVVRGSFPVNIVPSVPRMLLGIWVGLGLLDIVGLVRVVLVLLLRAVRIVSRLMGHGGKCGGGCCFMPRSALAYKKLPWQPKTVGRSVRVLVMEACRS
jgi:hypothetical protein